MRRGLTRILGLGIVVAMLVALWRAWSVRARSVAGEQEWTSSPSPFPPVPRPAPPRTSTAPPARTAPAAEPVRQVVVPPEVELGGGPETEQAGEVAIESITAWVEPIDGACPPSHPIKAKLSSGIYHSP